MKANLKKWTGLLAFVAIVLTTSCQNQTTQVFIEVDGGRQALTTTVATVREALTEAGITLEPLDRVNPDLYTRLEPGLVIVVTRVKEEIETEREIVPFERQTVTNEALAPGETRLAQVGASGEDEVSIRVVYEDGLAVSRTEISRVTVIEPVPEILVVGPKGALPSMPVEGVIAYLSSGNAWLMRDSSGSRRALTTEGNLDGRVFSLSPDGRRLLFTQKITGEIGQPLNELAVTSTTIVGEKPITLGITGVLNAAWSPVISQSLIAYSTAERTVNAPGWRANNDLWLLDLGRDTPQPQQVMPPNTQGLYPWWGTTFVWAPDGRRMAYARADQIGVITLTTSSPVSYSQAALVDFPPLKTFSEWVWVPGISWSPDGNFIAAVVHGPPLASEPAEESPNFDLWLFSANGTVSAKIAEQVGMWANPTWGEAGIAFGQALNSLRSANSRYSLQLVDRDGSNKRQLFPFREELGIQFPEITWLPQGHTLLFTYNGNLYTVDSNGSPPRQLTSDGQATGLSWAAQVPPMSGAAITAITATTALTASNTLSPTGPISTTPPVESSGAAVVTPAITITPDLTVTPTLTLTPSPPANTATPEIENQLKPTDVLTNLIPADQEKNQENNEP